LAPASGRRDHTASPSAKECRSSCDTLRVHRIPPRVRDDASAHRSESGCQELSTISEKKKEIFSTDCKGRATARTKLDNGLGGTRKKPQPEPIQRYQGHCSQQRYDDGCKERGVGPMVQVDPGAE
jgi:hypothetical protein